MKVILAIDDSMNSKEAVRSVVDREWPLDSQFKVLNVLEPLDCLGEKYEDLAYGVNVKRKKAAAHLCQAVREQLAATIPGATVHYEIRSGRPEDEIVEAAAEWVADRIMIGACGQDQGSSVLLGSVSRSVAKHAPCTVEIVRDNSKSNLSKSSKDSRVSAKV